MNGTGLLRLDEIGVLADDLLGRGGARIRLRPVGMLGSGGRGSRGGALEASEGVERAPFCSWYRPFEGLRAVVGRLTSVRGDRAT